MFAPHSNPKVPNCRSVSALGNGQRRSIRPTWIGRKLSAFPAAGLRSGPAAFGQYQSSLANLAVGKQTLRRSKRALQRLLRVRSTGERREASCDPATGRAFGERVSAEANR
jgi:hypothetical protein